MHRDQAVRATSTDYGDRAGKGETELKNAKEV